MQSNRSLIDEDSFEPVKKITKKKKTMLCLDCGKEFIETKKKRCPRCGGHYVEIL